MLPDKTTRAVIFQAANAHPIAFGIPPFLDTSVTGRYYGYFENEHREQFLFLYEYETKKASLWMGDNGWENPIPVVNGEVPTLILSKIEQMWLLSCWNAATAFEKKE